MPRTRRRRANDRRREAEQRRIAAEALARPKQIEKTNQDRYVKSVFRARAGEVIEVGDGRAYEVEHDGSLVRKEGMS